MPLAQIRAGQETLQCLWHIREGVRRHSNAYGTIKRGLGDIPMHLAEERGGPGAGR